MKIYIFLVLILISNLPLSAQDFTGQVFDSKTKQPIPYVNIGIIKKGIGTLSDEQGNFSLKIEDKFNEDSIKITILGYKYICYKVFDIKTKFSNTMAKFYLDENSFLLNEVVVRHVKYKTEIVGNRDLGSPCVTFLGDTSRDLSGCEIGTQIKIKKRPTFIDNIKFGICQNEFDSLTLRLNIYSKNNVNILKQPIYVKIKKGETQVTIDTKPYNIKVEDDFIIAFEALKIIQAKKGKGKIAEKKFSFSGGFTGSDMLTRMNIYDKWKKVNIVTIGFNATITYKDESKGKKSKWLFK